MPATVTLVQVRRGRDGRLYLRFDDKVELEFNSVAEARDYVGSGPLGGREHARGYAVAMWAAQERAGAVNTLEGATVAVDVTSVTPVVVTPRVGSG